MTATASTAGASRERFITLCSFPTRRRSEMGRRTRQWLQLLVRRVAHQADAVPDLRDDRIAGALGPPDHHVVAAGTGHPEAGLVLQKKLAGGIFQDGEERH